MTVNTLAPQVKFSKITSPVGSVLSDLDAPLSRSSNGEVSRIRDSKLMGDVERNSLKYPMSLVLSPIKWNDHRAAAPFP